MGIGGDAIRNLGGAWGVAPKPCDSCKSPSAAAVVFCHPDSAFLCLSCDTKIHCANKLASRHERVWMCEVCEQAPAAVTCKADAAALCVTCDADIHSANPLAQRHERVPVEPFYDSAESMVKSSSSAFNFLAADEPNLTVGSDSGRHEEAEAASWLLQNPNFNSNKLMDGPEMKPGDIFFSAMDSFIDFDYSDPISHNAGATDRVVPVQSKPFSAPVIHHSNEVCFDIDFCRSKLNTFSHQTQSLSQSVSSSSLDVGVVPDRNSMSDISYPLGLNVSNGSEPSLHVPATNQVAQLCGIDREARVLRYREKRKNRKFEKTIRYASRKAYAETRPRIKGRFAKRTETETETETELEHIYDSAPASFMADALYGVVPTF